METIFLTIAAIAALIMFCFILYFFYLVERDKTRVKNKEWQTKMDREAKYERELYGK